MKLETIGEDTSKMEQCIQIWRANSETLGFFPRGAFIEHARRGRILVAVTPSDKVAGYLLYRVSQRGFMLPRVVIVHLCVASEYRSQGIAKSLVNCLAESTNNKFMRIELKCRRDFDSNNIWPNLGFHAIGESEGRAGKPLVKWCMPFIHLPLFKVGSPADEQELYRLVIDANVFFRLEEPVPQGDEQAFQMSIEAKALVADWLPDSLGIYITDELHNEILRNDDKAHRAAMRRAAQKYGELTTDIEEMQSIESSLLAYFPENPSNQTRSDVRQLAHAIAGKAHFFVTQDTALLKMEMEFRENFAISVASPGEFVSFLDQTLRDVDFRPSQLAGVREIQDLHTSFDDVSDLYSWFRCLEMGEKKNSFNQQLRRYLSQPDQYSLRLVTNAGSDQHLLVMATETPKSDLLRIPFIRISALPLARTVARYKLLVLVLQGARKNIHITTLEDSCPDPALREAIGEIGFLSNGSLAARISLDLMGTIEDLAEDLARISLAHPVLRDILKQIIEMAKDASRSTDLIQFAELERLLWPLKLKGIQLRTYLIPIHPQWSMHLFDKELADQTLWGATENIALSIENVYYRSAAAGSFIEAPARILWYVTDGFGYSGVKRIRACSSLEEVSTASASDLFKRFSRLGVYTWDDILRTANGDPNRDIMALRFSYTEMFPQPIMLGQLGDVLQNIEGKSLMLHGPSELDPRTFEALYSIGTRRN